MRRWLKIGVISAVSPLFCLAAAMPAWAGPGPSAGARPAAFGLATQSTQSVTAQVVPTFFEEVTAAFTASPTTGGFGEALAASRATFSSTETIEFNSVLLASGLAGTTADLGLYVFDPRGRLAAGPFFITVQAPDDRTDFFITMNGASLFVTGRLNWVITISDAFGRFFVTGLHPFEIQ